MTDTRKLDVQILNPKGHVIFEKKNFEVPKNWSDRAATIVASKYAMDSEFSAIDIIDRVVKQITKWGVEQGYFNKEQNKIGREVAEDFMYSLENILINQRAAFNSPVWFNCGSDTGTNQMSACFIVPVEDTMESILKHNTTEGLIFRGGSGAGCNVSILRGKGEKLSNKGEASGPISFMKMWDATAGVIRSGGKCLAPWQKVYTNEGPIEVKDLALKESFYTLSYDPPAGRYKMKKARAWKQEIKKEVLEIVTDKGKFHTTADHPIKINGTGEYRLAKDLKKGNSLFQCSIDKPQDYLRIHLRDGNKSRELLHRMIAKDILNEDGIVHHKDGNKLNNKLDNIEIITQAEHARKHAEDLVSKGEHVFQIKSFDKSGSNNGMHKDNKFWEDEEKVKNLKEKHSKNLQDLTAKEMQKKATFVKMLNFGYQLINKGYDISTYNSYFNARLKESNSKGIGIGKTKLLEKIKLKFGSYENFYQELRANNHEVVSITSLGDMEVFSVEVDCPTKDDKSPNTGHNYVLWPDDNSTGSGITVSNTRRSAKLICMDADHPDIMEFITCKLHEEQKAKALIKAGISQEEAYGTVAFQNTNHSIRVSNEFMTAYEANKDYRIIPRGKYTKETMASAREVLKKTAEIAWATGDPGIQFDSRMNLDNPVPSVGKINSTNPCLTADMELLTNKGYLPIGKLVNKEVVLINKNGNKSKGKIWSNGKKNICEIKFHWKSELENLKCTPDHIWMLNDGTECEAKDLQGKRLMPQETSIKMGNNFNLEKNAFLAGFIQGDGNPQRLKSSTHKKVEVYFGEKDSDIAKLFGQGIGTWYSGEAAKVVEDFKIEQTPLPERRLPYSITSGPKNKEKTNFISGLFSANGCVIKDTRIALKTTCKTLALDLKSILHHDYNIESYITTNKPHRVIFKNGEYECKESYDLNIYRYIDIIKFYHTFWFAQEYKREALLELIIKRSPTVTAVIDAGEEEVFDFNEPKTHWGIVNGFICHNCSEFSAVDNSSCNLASLNLVKYYNIETKEWNKEQFEKDIRTMITAMDILIDAADYPTPEIRETTTRTRPLGLGFSNLGALLMLMGLPYDSEDGRLEAARITKEMTTYAYLESINLAKKLGSFYYYEDNKEKNLEITTRLTENNIDVMTNINKYGLRNSQLTLLAPTGTISFMMDCDTTGIEPLFALKTIKQLSGGGTMLIEYPCVRKAWDLYGYALREGDDIIEEIKITDDEDLLDLFETSNEISWKGHVDMMAACQPYLNGAISKTVNMPSNCIVEDIENAYMYAWKAGLKSLAIYRDGSKKMQPISDMKNKKEEDVQNEEPQWSAVRKQLPRTRDSMTHAFNISGFEGYLTVGLYDDGSPGEMFINMQKQGSTLSGLMDSFAVLLSFALQYGVPLEKLISKFRGTKFEPAGFTDNPDIRMTSSPMDYVFRWLDNEFYGTEEDPVQQKQEESKFEDNLKPIDASGPACIECGHTTILNGTCFQCLNCGANTGCS